MMPFYRIILRKAVNLSWRFKWLWFFGFFAAFIGNGSLYEALLRTMSGLSTGDSPFLVFKDYAKVGVFALLSPDKISTLWNADSGAFGMLLLASICYIAAVAILIILSVIGQGATVSAAVQLDGGSGTVSFSVRDISAESWQSMSLRKSCFSARWSPSFICCR
jgi:hypothetical protein